MALTQITEKGIKDGEIINADINASAAIAGSKIAPDFGSQNILTTGNTGIGESSPANLLHVKVSDTGIAPHSSAQIVLERSGTNYLQFLTAADGTSGLVFGDANDNDVGKIVYDHNVTELQFNTETNQRMKITGGGVVQIGGNIANNADIDTSNSKLTIKQSANSQEDGIYIERSGERRGFYIYMGGALGVSDGLCFTTNQLGGDTHILAMDRGGDVKIGNGSLILSSAGEGIDFSAAGGSSSGSASALLDDYEEGTFTPNYDASGGVTFTYSQQYGFYTKIGDTVFFTIYLQGYASTITGGNENNGVALQGLPFTIKNHARYNPAFTIGRTYKWDIDSDKRIYSYGTPNSTNARFIIESDDSTGSIAVASQLNANTTEMFLNGHYKI